MSFNVFYLECNFLQSLPEEFAVHQVVFLATSLSRDQKRKLDQLAQILHTKCVEDYSHEGIFNKKVLLRERKRHTARRVVTAPSVVLTGYPPPPPS